MAIFPLQAFLAPLSDNPWTYLVFGLIGFAFGFVLEISGFGNSKILAAQFYFKNLTVLKVMFGAIVTAMVLIFLSSAIGILDYNLLWVNPTYLWPGLLGGLIMGVGFITGGFCPGTSLVSAATLKLDGIFFALGTLFGVWAFSDTVDFYWQWWNTSGYYGRLTLMDVFHLPTGVVVLLVTCMALFMFWGGEKLECIFGKRDLSKEPKMRVAGAGALLALALVVLLLGQPTNQEKWSSLAAEKELALAALEVQIHPGELLASLADNRLQVIMLDVRSEADYNLFHIHGARHIPLDEIPFLVPGLLAEPSSNTVVVVMSNDESAATQAWKILVAEAIPNVYILEGGVNHWIRVFGMQDNGIRPIQASASDDHLQFDFEAALGDRYISASPNPHEWDLEYTPKIKLERKRGPGGGGCG